MDPEPITVPSVADLIIIPVLLGVNGFMYRKHSESTNSCAFEKLSDFVRTNDGFHSSLAWTEPFAVISVNTLPLGVVMLKFFFDAILSASYSPMREPSEAVV